jgi:tetratricopeptide (TPR) repeat protein
VSVVEVADLRLQLARLLASDDRIDEAIREAKAGLAETDEPATRWQFHDLIGTLLLGRSRLTDALDQWIHAIITAPELSGVSAQAAAQTLDGPRSEVLARQIADDQVEALQEIVARPEASFASQILLARVRRLRSRGDDSSSAAPPPPPVDGRLTDDLRALLAEEYAATGRLDDALLTLDSAMPATSPRAMAVRARMLIRLGRPREVLHLDLPDLPPEDPALQSLAASCALAQLAAQEPDLAAAFLKPYLDKPGIDAQMAAVVVALSQQEYAAADTLLVGLESLSGRNDDIRLLRAQIHLEQGEIEGIDRGQSLLERLAKSRDPAIARSSPMWLGLQREVRSYEDRFGFVWVEWVAFTKHPDVLPALEAARRASTTYAQDAVMDMLWADQLAASQPTEAADHFADAADHWRLVAAPDRALHAARRAEELVPGGYGSTIAEILVEHGQNLLRGVDHDSIREALSLAQQSWHLTASQGAAALWADAAVSQTYEDPSGDSERLLLDAIHNLSSLEQNSTVAEYRGRLLLRLGDVAAEDRVGYSRHAAEWLLASALAVPGDQYPWLWLTWAFNALGAFALAVDAADKALELGGDEGVALVGVVASRLNQLGIDTGIDGLIDRLERLDPTWTAWAAGLRLIVAMLAGQTERVPALLDQKIQEPDFATTIAEARMLISDPEAASYAETSFRRNLDENAWGSAARMMLLQGRVDEALELSARAERTRCERPRAVWYISTLARLMSGELAVEAELEADIGRSICPGDLRSNLAIDFPLLLRTVPPDSPAALAVDRLRLASEARLRSLQALPQVSPADDLDEVNAPCLVALCELWRADRETDPDWATVVAASASVVSCQEDSGLHSIQEAAAAAVADRAAQRLLDAIKLLPADAAGTAEPQTGWESIRDWVAAIADDDREVEGRALLVLQILLTGGTSLDEAVTLAGLSAEQAEPDRLAEQWGRRVPDTASWWRFHDTLEARLPASQWVRLRDALTGRLTEICGMAVVPTIDSRSPQSLLMGESLVPDDTSDAWVMFSRYLPEIRKVILDRTGVQVPGFSLRGDPILDRCLTYTLSDRIAEFVRLSDKVRVLPAGPEEPYDIQDPVTREPLRLVPDPNLTSPDEPPDGEDAGDGKSVTWLVARHLTAWSQAHLAELFFPYHVNEIVRLRPDLAPELDEPATIIRWLDASRRAIEAERKLDVDLMADLLLGASASPDPAEAAARVSAALAPWGPAPEVLP